MATTGQAPARGLAAFRGRWATVMVALALLAGGMLAVRLRREMSSSAQGATPTAMVTKAPTGTQHTLMLAETATPGTFGASPPPSWDMVKEPFPTGTLPTRVPLPPLTQTPWMATPTGEP